MVANSSPPTGTEVSAAERENGLVLAPKYGADGLVAAIATDALTGSVLMFAWMNSEALSKTIETGYAHFWSRSRGRLWKKGEESGNLLEVAELLVDCDQDAVWLRVKVAGEGRACHTGAVSCFYRRVTGVGDPGGTIALERADDDGATSFRG